MDDIYMENETDNIRLNLDTSVLYEREGRNSSILDKFGLPVFDKDIFDAINKYTENEQMEISYLRERVFDNNLSDSDDELLYIKKQVFLSKQIKWEPLDVNEEKTGKGFYIWIVFILLIPLAVLFMSRKKRIRKDVDTYKSDFK